MYMNWTIVRVRRITSNPAIIAASIDNVWEQMNKEIGI